MSGYNRQTSTRTKRRLAMLRTIRKRIGPKARTIRVEVAKAGQQQADTGEPT